MRIVWFIVLSGLLAEAPAAISSSARSRHTEATLISNYAALPSTPQNFSVFLRLKMDPHWHTYWLNPGDAGLATSIQWTLPPGFSADPIKWPSPQLISDPPLLSYGYENEVWLAVDLHSPGGLKAGQAVHLRAQAKWLECHDVCIPAKADLALDLPVESRTRLVTDPKLTGELTTAARLAFHFDVPNQRNEAYYDASSIHFLIRDFFGREDSANPNSATAHPFSSMRQARFIPVEPGLIQDSADQTFHKLGRNLEVVAPRDLNTPRLPATYDGILRFDYQDGEKSWTQDIYSSGPLSPRIEPPPARPVRVGPASWILALAAAFLGGLILNLMPCVLPVLSLKVLALVEQARQENRSSLSHGLAFTAGVLVTFWGLAAILLGFQHAGQHLGWGFQLQNPTVVVVLAALFYLIGLNLFGVFEIGTSLTSVQWRGAGLSQSFGSGLLATIVATPCTAPFMGSALGFAFSQPAWVAGLIFTFLGLGMAAPYLILSASPGLLRYVPRPGAWMETFKQLMGFPMMASVLWLLWVFSRQAGTDPTISALLGLLFISLGAWLFGRYGSAEKASGTRFVASGVAACLMLVGLGIAIPPTRDAGSDTALKWEKFDPARLQQLHEAGTPVFIDFTASWCLTCQVNKRVALSPDEVQARFKEKGVVLMEADWTNQDATISQALQGYGRNSVPVYVLYGRDPAGPPEFLPEILTPEIVLQALSKL